jgi:hypothetical protein
MPSPRLARRGGEARLIAEAVPRSRFGVGARRPASRKLLGAERDVQRHLFTQLAVEARLAQRIRDAKP